MASGWDLAKRVIVEHPKSALLSGYYLLQLGLLKLLKTEVLAKPIFNLVKPIVSNSVNMSEEDKSDVHRAVTLSIQVFKAIAGKPFPYGIPNAKVFEKAGFLWALVESPDYLWVVCRGSANDDNWVDNLGTFPVKNGHVGARISEGYSELLNAFEFKHIYEANDKPIVVTGASLGGAMAILIGWALDNKGFDVHKIITFGNPRFTAADYSHLPLYQFHHLNDPVVYAPPYSIIARYRHQGPRYVYDSKTDAWTRWKDSVFTDIALSAFAQSDTDIAEHMTYGQTLERL